MTLPSVWQLTIPHAGRRNEVWVRYSDSHDERGIVKLVRWSAWGSQGCRRVRAEVSVYRQVIAHNLDSKSLCVIFGFAPLLRHGCLHRRCRGLPILYITEPQTRWIYPPSPMCTLQTTTNRANGSTRKPDSWEPTNRREGNKWMKSKDGESGCRRWCPTRFHLCLSVLLLLFARWCYRPTHIHAAIRVFRFFLGRF